MVDNARSTGTRDAEPGGILQGIRGGRWREPVEAIRAAYRQAVTEGRDPKAAVADMKRALPAVLWSGRFTRRAKGELETHSGLLVADIDGLSEADAGEVSRRLSADPYAVAGFISPTATGVKVLFSVLPDPEQHGASFAAVRDRLWTEYRLSVDESGKDVSRLCFVSWDQNAWENSSPEMLRPLAPEPRPIPTTSPPSKYGRPPEEAEVRDALSYISPDCSRDQWLRIGMALHDGFGEAGKALWREWSLGAPDRFNEKDFERDWSSFRSGGGVTIATLFRIARANGWRSHSPRRESSARAMPATAGAPVGEEATDLQSWVRGQIVGILSASARELTVTEKNRIVGETVVKGLVRAGQFYFHAERRDFDSAMFFNRETKRLDRVRSDFFGAWLSGWTGLNRADQCFKFVQAAVDTAALSGELTRPIIPEAFWAARPGAIYLSNGDGSVARIAPDRVELVENGTDGVLFPVGRTLAPWKLLDAGLDPFVTCSVFSGARLLADHGLDLARLWAFSLPTTPRSKPPMCFAGDVGSGKTRFSKGLAELFGLPFVASKVEEDGEDDFWPNVDGGGLYVLDNADTKCRWLADTLATAATDGCTVRRKLYTNSETVTLRARAWVAVTTANPTFASDAGLADRLLVVRMGRREGESSDAALSDEIAANRDAGLTFIAWALASALADSTPVPGGLNRRHPDFANFAVRIGRAIGRESEAVSALQAAESDKASFCLENDAVGSALIALLDGGSGFKGTALELLNQLGTVDPEFAGRWNARRLGKRLSALWPHLEQAFPGAKRGGNRDKVTVFTFGPCESAGFAGFPELISQKSP